MAVRRKKNASLILMISSASIKNRYPHYFLTTTHCYLEKQYISNAFTLYILTQNNV